MNNFPTVLFLVRGIAKLERERSVFCPRLFRERGGQGWDWRPSRGCCCSSCPCCCSSFCSSFCGAVKSIEDLCEKFSNSVVFGKGLRKTAARTLLFSSGALPGRSRCPMRPGGAREKEPLKASFVWGKKIFTSSYIPTLREKAWLRKKQESEKPLVLLCFRWSSFVFPQTKLAFGVLSL